MFRPLPSNIRERPKLCYVYARENHLPELNQEVADPNEEWRISIERETLTEFAFLMRIVAPYYLYLTSHRQFYFKGKPVESCMLDSPLLLRGHYSDVRVARQRMHPELQYNCQKSENMVYSWVSHLTSDLRQQFIKRPVAVVTYGDICGGLADLAELFGSDGRVFVRTQREQRAGFRFVSAVIPDGSRGWWDWQRVVPVIEPCLVSRVVTFEPDRKMRCFVIDGRVSSISRFIDSEFESWHPDGGAFAQRFVDGILSGEFPASFVMDIVETSDLGWVVLELHPIGSSARYVNNRCDWFVSDLYGIDCRMTDFQYERFQLDVDNGNIVN